MSFNFAAARGGGFTPPLPRPERSRCHRWLVWGLGVAWTASGCTLTADSFEPRPVDPAFIDDTPVVSGLLPMPAEGPRENQVTSVPSGETNAADGLTPTPSLAPVDTNGGTPGGASQDTEAAVAGLDDADADEELAAPAGANADAGAPATLVEPCTTMAFASSCYEVFAELASWDVAEQRCLDWGGHLASVESAEEDDFLGDWPSALGIFGQDGSGVWLGGTDAPGGAEFRWAAEDSPLAFDNWGPNQPDNGAGVDCIEKRNDAAASWYDRRCTDAQRYVCERPR